MATNNWWVVGPAGAAHGEPRRPLVRQAKKRRSQTVLWRSGPARPGCRARGVPTARRRRRRGHSVGPTEHDGRRGETARPGGGGGRRPGQERNKRLNGPGQVTGTGWDSGRAGQFLSARVRPAAGGRDRGQRGSGDGGTCRAVIDTDGSAPPAPQDARGRHRGEERERATEGQRTGDGKGGKRGPALGGRPAGGGGAKRAPGYRPASNKELVATLTKQHTDRPRAPPPRQQTHARTRS